MQFRFRIGKVLAPQMNGKSSILVDDGIWKDRLSSWDLRPASPSSTSDETPPEEKRSTAVYRIPPHVLEIGCSDGSWCLNLKRNQPDWIFHGLDDTNHWSCVTEDTTFG